MNDSFFRTLLLLAASFAAGDRFPAIFAAIYSENRAERRDRVTKAA